MRFRRISVVVLACLTLPSLVNCLGSGTETATRWLRAASNSCDTWARAASEIPTVANANATASNTPAISAPLAAGLAVIVRPASASMALRLVFLLLVLGFLACAAWLVLAGFRGFELSLSGTVTTPSCTSMRVLAWAATFGS